MFAAIYIPEFPAEAVLRAREELRHGAIAVVEGAPPQSYVVAVNEHARRCGINPGMARMQAEQLLPDNSSVIVVRSQVAEGGAHAALLDAAYSISPRVEDSAADLVVLDVSGLERLFGTAQQIARQLAARVGAQGLEANIAVAANPYSAEHAARGFTGITVIAEGTEADRLGSLRLEILFDAEAAACERDTALTHDERHKRLDRLARMQQTLDRWGIRNFRTLGSLPPVSLSERLGRHGVRLQQLASGTLTRELALADPPLVFVESIELEHSVENLESLLFVLSRLLEQISARLHARALYTNELRLCVRVERVAADDASLTNEELNALGPGEIERKLTLPVPMNDARLFLKLWHLQLSSRPLGAPVTEIRLTAEAARPRVTQPGLFVPLAPEPEKLELTLARLNKLLAGAPDSAASANPVPNAELRTGCAEIVDTHQPNAFRMVRFRSPENTETRESTISTAAPKMALRRVRPPAAATVLLRDGHPVRVQCESVRCELSQDWTREGDNVVWAAGPWKSSGNWWCEGESNFPADESSAHPWNCEEWDVAVALTVQQPAWRDEDGRRRGGRRTRATHVALYRIHRDITANDQWFIDGSYD